MTLEIRNVSIRIPGRDVPLLSDISLIVKPGEIHALMGPNGSGKSSLSHALMGRAGYEISAGSVIVNGRDVTELPTWERASAGLFLGMQYPVEVAGVRMEDFLTMAQPARAQEIREALRTEAARLDVDESFLQRPVNVEFSGGEKKRNEILQLAVLQPAFAVLDEIDSGLDVDALRQIAERIRSQVVENDLGILAITHYARLLTYLKPDVVHVLMNGQIVTSGGSELADELEKSGYEDLAQRLGIEPVTDEPDDPFADQLAP